jgi:hypothetical protein
MRINTLPVEIFIRINQFLDIEDILQFARISKFMQKIFINNKIKFYKMIFRGRGFYNFPTSDNKLCQVYRQMHKLFIVNNDIKYFNIPDILTYNKNYKLILDFFIQNQEYIYTDSIKALTYLVRRNVLTIACITGHQTIALLLVKVNPCIASYAQLHYAIAHNHPQIVKTLLKYNDYDIWSKRQALQFSIKRNNMKITECILSSL